MKKYLSAKLTELRRCPSTVKPAEVATKPCFGQLAGLTSTSGLIGELYQGNQDCGNSALRKNDTCIIKGKVIRSFEMHRNSHVCQYTWYQVTGQRELIIPHRRSFDSHCPCLDYWTMGQSSGPAAKPSWI